MTRGVLIDCEVDVKCDISLLSGGPNDGVTSTAQTCIAPKTEELEIRYEKHVPDSQEIFEVTSLKNLRNLCQCPQSPSLFHLRGEPFIDLRSTVQVPLSAPACSDKYP